MSLRQAIAHVEGLGRFRPSQRIYWIYFRKDVEKWREKHARPQIDAAFHAVADMPETLPDEAERWEELLHQVMVELQG